jgi:hypothetical protein
MDGCAMQVSKKVNHKPIPLCDLVELPLTDSPTLSIKSVIGPYRHRDASNIASYLRSASAMYIIPGLTRNIFDTRDDNELVIHIRTDGIWYWRQDLSFYVDNYHLWPPDPFVEHVRQNRWTPPEVGDEELLRLQQQIVKKEWFP